MATPINKSTSQRDNGGATAGGLCRNYGFMESRIAGIMELWIGRVGSQLKAHCS